MDPDDPKTANRAGARTDRTSDPADRIVDDIAAQLAQRHRTPTSVGQELRKISREIGERSVITYVREGLKQTPPVDYWTNDRFRNFVLVDVLDDIVREARAIADTPGPNEFATAASTVMSRADTRVACEAMLDDVHGGRKWRTPVCGLGFGKAVKSL